MRRAGTSDRSPVPQTTLEHRALELGVEQNHRPTVLGRELPEPAAVVGSIWLGRPEGAPTFCRLLMSALVLVRTRCRVQKNGAARVVDDVVLVRRPPPS